MLSCSVDPDQDLQSGSKLFTGTHYLHGMMYAVIQGGDYVLVVKFSRGDYVLVVKFSGGGGLCPSCKIQRGGGGGGGIMS